MGKSLLVGAVVYTALNALYIYSAAAGFLGPVWPEGFLGLAVLAVILSVGILVAGMVGRVSLWLALGSMLILAGTAVLNYWAAWASSAAC